MIRNRLLAYALLGCLAFWALVVFGISRAFAGDAMATWVQPTKNTDGSTIPASGTGRLTGNRLEWGTCTGTAPSYAFGVKSGEQIFTAPATTYTVTGLAPGTWCFRAYASTTYGESAPSGVAFKTIAPPLPQPPSGLVIADTTVFTVVKRPDRFVMLPVGTAPAGTPCDTSQSVNGYYVIPRAVVTWSGTVRPDVVVATCG